MDVHEYNNIHQYRQPGRGSPTPIIRVLKYNASGVLTHAGYAFQGSDESEAVWTIEKLFYDASGNFNYTLVSPKNSIMNNYDTTVVYS
jgi:hypothetical protein